MHRRLTPTDSHGHVDIGVHVAKNLDQFQEQEESLSSSPKEVGQHEVVEESREESTGVTPFS